MEAQSSTHWKVKVKVTQLCPTLLQSRGLHGILQARILEWVAFPFSRGSSQPRDRTQVSCIEGGFFTSWATRESQNTGVGSLSLLQRIFPTQESNRGLLHCRWILYQLSYQGSPNLTTEPPWNSQKHFISDVDNCLILLIRKEKKKKEEEKEKSTHARRKSGLSYRREGHPWRVGWTQFHAWALRLLSGECYRNAKDMGLPWRSRG